MVGGGAATGGADGGVLPQLADGRVGGGAAEGLMEMGSAVGRWGGAAEGSMGRLVEIPTRRERSQPDVRDPNRQVRPGRERSQPEGETTITNNSANELPSAS